MQSGIYNMSFEDYKAIDALNNSTLVAMKKTPAHALIEKEPTPGMLFGKAFDCFLLEPHLFEKAYAVVPEGMKLTTKDGKAWAEENKGKEIIKREDFNTFEKMDESLCSGQYELANNLVTKGVAQLSVIWNHSKFGIPCKCRPDLMVSDLGIIADIKTTTNADPSWWFRNALNSGFCPHFQGAFYLEGANTTGAEYTDFLWIVFETKPPFGISVIRAPKEMVYLAQEEIKVLIPQYMEYKRKGHWPAYPDKIVEAVIPPWYFRQAEI